MRDASPSLERLGYKREAATPLQERRGASPMRESVTPLREQVGSLIPIIRPIQADLVHSTHSPAEPENGRNAQG
jgi:hypothetical protein